MEKELSVPEGPNIVEKDKRCPLFLHNPTEGDGYMIEWYQISCYNTRAIMGNKCK
jgi:hypothetical protein